MINSRNSRASRGGTMKKTLVVATSLAALSACSQIDTPHDEAHDTNLKPAESATLIDVNPFLAVPVEDTAASTGENADLTENTPTDDVAETTPESETTPKVIEDRGWVVYSPELLEADNHIPPSVVDIIENRHDEIVAAPEPVVEHVPEVSARPSLVDGGPVFFDVLLEGQFSGITQQQMVVIRDQASFDQIWADHNTTAPPVDQPVVDFSHDMIIAIFRGTTAQCTEQLSVSRILESDTLDVHATISVAETDAQCFVAEQDFVFVTLRQTDKVVNLHTQILSSVAATPVAPRSEYLRDKIELVYRHIVDNIGDATCYDNSQCAALALGARACGGPQSYLAYSTYNTDVDYLHTLAADHRDTSQAANQFSQLLSACQFVGEPLVACRVDRCVIDADTITLREPQIQ